MTNTVTTQTGRRLAAAGFPQPNPAPGQWWGYDNMSFLVWGKWQDGPHVSHTVIEHTPSAQPRINFYFDDRDFRGLVYLPTVGDILGEIAKATKGVKIVRIDVSSHNGGDADDTPMFCIYTFPYGNSTYNNIEAAEAAALAYLSIHEKK